MLCDECHERPRLPKRRICWRCKKLRLKPESFIRVKESERIYREAHREELAEAQRIRREDPLVGARHRAAVRAYQGRHPDKRRRWVRAWRQRTGGEFRNVNGITYFYQHDDIKLLWAANRELEQALAEAGRREEVRFTDEGGGDDGAEW